MFQTTSTEASLTAAAAWPDPQPESAHAAGRATRPACALIAALAVALLLWPHAGTLGRDAVWALAVFAAALIGWTVLRWDETAVALAAALVLVVAGVVEPGVLHAALGNDLTWLLLGGFLLAAVLDASGLARLWALRAVGGARSAGSLMWRLTGLIACTAFVIPSTSARAALLLPVFTVVAHAAAQPRLVRALALLFPTVILLSAGASLLGAGAHLIAVDTLRHLGLPAPGFLGWAAWAAPFSLLACLLALWVITHVFLDANERHTPLQLPDVGRHALKPEQRRTAVIVALAIGGFATSAWHGVELSIVAWAAALAATTRTLTGVTLKTALRKVEWNLLLFLAATLVLGHALLDSGAAQALARGAVVLLPAGTGPVGLVAATAAMALLSHLLITSRSARAMVLLPAVALPLAAAGANPALLVFVAVIGSGFCQTLAVSSKPVALFAQAEGPTFSDSDLLRLSLALLPLLFGLLMLFALVIWPLQGLPLTPR